MQILTRRLQRLGNPLLYLIFYQKSKLQHPHKIYNQGQQRADMILRNYFNKRSELNPISMVELLDRLKILKLGTGFFNDHRWIHLNMQIQKNIEQFSNQQLIQILDAFQRIKCFSETFNSIFCKLTAKLNDLSPNQKSLMFYFLAKSGKPNKQVVLSLSDSLIKSLNQQNLKLVTGLKKRIIKSQQKVESQQKQKQNQEQQQQQEIQISLFTDFNHQKSAQANQLDLRNLLLCFWSLQKMRVKDKILTDLIVKKFIKPNISSIPCNIFPLILSTLWLNDLHLKRVFSDITLQLTKRQNQLINLDRDKLVMLANMLCKPQIELLQRRKKSQIKGEVEDEVDIEKQRQLSQTRKKIVIWILQTLLIRRQKGKQILHSSSCYRLITNANLADFFQFQIFNKYIKIICSDIAKIQVKQMIYLLSIIKRLRIYHKKNIEKTQNQGSTQILSAQYNVLKQKVVQNLFGFLNKHEVGHPARNQLKRMVISQFLTIPVNLKRRVLLQERRETKKRLIKTRQQQADNKSQNRKESVNKNSGKNQTTQQLNKESSNNTFKNERRRSRSINKVMEN